MRSHTYYVSHKRTCTAYGTYAYTMYIIYYIEPPLPYVCALYHVSFSSKYAYVLYDLDQCIYIYIYHVVYSTWLYVYICPTWFASMYIYIYIYIYILYTYTYYIYIYHILYSAYLYIYIYTQCLYYLYAYTCLIWVSSLYRYAM